VSPYGLVAAALVFILVAPAWTRPLQDPDLWWLLWAGEEMMAGRWPDRNGLSWTAPAQPWITHEPLVAWIYAAAGVERVAWVRGAVCSLTGLLLVALARRPASAWATVLALLWVGPLVSVGVSERALAWGDLALAATSLALLAGRGPTPPRWAHPLAAALVALWSLLHGSFVLGLGLLALQSPGWAAAPAAATLLHPAGPALWGLIAGYGTGSGAQGLVHTFVAEWGWLTPSDLPQTIRLICLLSGLALTASTPGWRPKLVALAVGALAIRHARYVDPAGIATLPYVARRLEGWLPGRALGRPLPLLAAALAVCALAAPRAGPDPALWPEELLERLPRGPGTWSDFTLGAWHARAGVPAFWDSRNDCYPVEVVADGIRVAYRQAGWLDALGSWGVERVLTRDPALVDALRAEGWRPLDEAAGLTLLGLPGAPSGR